MPGVKAGRAPGHTLLRHRQANHCPPFWLFSPLADFQPAPWSRSGALVPQRQSMGAAHGEPVHYQCIFGADAHPETGQEAGGWTLTPLTAVMDSDSELQIASADLGFNQSTDPGPGDSVIFSDYLPRSLVRILDLGYTLESPSELIKRGLGVSQKPPGDSRAQLGWCWRCCHLPRLHCSHP